MPRCYRCERENLPTGELRKTTLGFVCLGGENRFSRCRTIERQLRNERRATAREALQPTERAEASVG
jgi:hypothetical protein